MAGGGNYNLGTATGTIRIEYDSNGVRRARNDLGRYVSAQQDANQKIAASGDAMQKAGAVIVAGLAGAATVAADFEAKLSAVKAVSGATADEMQQLRDKALAIGKDTSFSAGEGALAIEELVKAGVSVTDVMNGAADATVALAAAGEIELPEAATIASNAMNQFQLGAEALPKVADLIAGAANASAIDVGQFGYSLSQVGAVANLAGASFDDTATAIALLGNAGIVGSDAGTSLKSMLSNLQPGTEKQISLFNELGLAVGESGNAFYDAEGNLKSLSDISGILKKSMKGLTKQQQQQALETLFGADAIRAAAILAENGSKGFDKMAESMGKVTAEDVAATRLDNVKGSVEALKGSVETLAIQLGTPLLGSVRAVVDGLNTLVSAFLALDPEVQNAILAATAVTGALLLIVGTFLKVKAALAAGSLLFGAISLPILAVIAAIAALVGAFVYFFNTNAKFRDTVKRIGEAVKTFLIDTFNRALPYIKQFGDFLVDSFNRALPYIKAMGPVLQRVGAFLVEKFQEALPYIKALGPVLQRVGSFLATTFQKALPYIKEFGAFLAELAGLFMDDVLPVIVQVGKAIGEELGKQIDKLGPVLAKMVPAVRDFVMSVVEFGAAVYERVRPALATMIAMLGTVARVFMTTILPLLLRVGGVFTNVFVSTIGNALRTALGIIRGVLNVISGVIKVFTGILQGDFRKAWDGVKQIFRGVGGILISIIRGIGSGIGTAVRGIKDLLVAGVRAIPGALRGLGKLFLQAGSFIIDQFVNGIKSAAGLISGIAGNVWDFVKGLINGAISSINRALEFTINPPGPGSVTINPPDIPGLATGGRVTTSGRILQIAEGGEPETVLPDSLLRGLLERVHRAGQYSAQPIIVGGGGGGSGSGKGGGGGLRMVRGVLDLAPSGRAFIEGVAQDVYDDNDDYDDTLYRMGSNG